MVLRNENASVLRKKFASIRNALTVAAYKHSWVLARRAELHARGLRDSAIAQQMGYKPPYFSQVVKGDAPTGDTFIDKMCSAFGFTFLPTSVLSDNATPSVRHEGELVNMVERLLDQADRSAAREQVRDNLMNAMYDLLRANGVKLDGLREKMDQLKTEGV